MDELYYDCAETDRAVRAWFRWCKRIDPDNLPPMPGRWLTRREGDTIIIENGPGVLARYRVGHDGKLRKVRTRLDDED